MHAECAIYTTTLHICRNPCERLYSRRSLEIVAAAWVQSFCGDTWVGRGDVAWLYFKKGRNK